MRDSRISTARGRRYRVYLERTAPGGPAVTRAVRSLRASAWTQARRRPYSPVSVSAARKGWDLMRRLASGGALPGLTGRGCTLAAPAPGRSAAAGRQAPGRWCRTGTGASHPRRLPPRCALTSRPS